MNLFRTAANPWGQNILVGIAWDLMWAALFAGIAFTVVHAIYVRIMAPVAERGDTVATVGTAIPERIERHSRSARGFHWLMALAMFALLITAFFPVVGVRFPWVTIHWAAGLALLLLVAWHIFDSIVRHDGHAMEVAGEDLDEARRGLARFFRRQPDPDPRTGKYPLDQKLYHHAVTVVTLGAIVTGVLMMRRIDTIFWASDPYVLSDATWGLVFVLHGLCGVGLITLTIVHVYFAIRPEKRWMTRSMIKGWITRDEYLEHYDPARWPLEPEPRGHAGRAGVAGDSDAAVTA